MCGLKNIFIILIFLLGEYFREKEQDMFMAGRQGLIYWKSEIACNWAHMHCSYPSEFLKASINYLFMEELFYEQKVSIRCLIGKGIKKNVPFTWHWKRQLKNHLKIIK